MKNRCFGEHLIIWDRVLQLFIIYLRPLLIYTSGSQLKLAPSIIEKPWKMRVLYTQVYVFSVYIYFCIFWLDLFVYSSVCLSTLLMFCFCKFCCCSASLVYKFLALFSDHVMLTLISCTYTDIPLFVAFTYWVNIDL